MHSFIFQSKSLSSHGAYGAAWDFYYTLVVVMVVFLCFSKCSCSYCSIRDIWNIYIASPFPMCHFYSTLGISQSSKLPCLIMLFSNFRSSYNSNKQSLGLNYIQSLSYALLLTDTYFQFIHKSWFINQQWPRSHWGTLINLGEARHHGPWLVLGGYLPSHLPKSHGILMNTIHFPKMKHSPMRHINCIEILIKGIMVLTAFQKRNGACIQGVSPLHCLKEHTHSGTHIYQVQGNVSFPQRKYFQL